MRASVVEPDGQQICSIDRSITVGIGVHFLPGGLVRPVQACKSLPLISRIVGTAILLVIVQANRQEIRRVDYPIVVAVSRPHLRSGDECYRQCAWEHGDCGPSRVVRNDIIK